MALSQGGRSFRCAVVQMRSTDDVAANLKQAEDLVRAAVADGAEVVTLPENFAWLRISPEMAAPVQRLDGPVVTRMRELAQSCNVHLLLGSIPEDVGDPVRNHNTSVWLGPDGDVLSTYRKLYLFDIDIPGTETQRESDCVRPGEGPVVADTELARFGLSICYDLRFPELYRRLVEKGANCLCIPAAFTLTTGKEHWHVLLRARAIENQCYVLAPAQWGHHGGKRNSYGHSVIIDPWGTVVAEIPDGTGYAVARLDLARVDQVRTHLPCLQHRRSDIG